MSDHTKYQVIDFPPDRLTAFGRLRTSQSVSLGDLCYKYNVDSHYLDTDTSAGGAVVHKPLVSGIELSVSGASASRARMRTNKYFAYQSGKGQRISVAGAPGGANANQTKRWGYFDDNDGVFFELNLTQGLCIVVRSSITGTPVDTRLPQASWNNDRLDGTGTSGVSINLSAIANWEINIQWFGVGDGYIYVNGILVHKRIHFAAASILQIATAILPVSWEIVNSGSSTAAAMTFFSHSVTTEGVESYPHYVKSSGNTIDKNVGGTEEVLFGIRPKTMFNSLPNRGTIVPVKISIWTEGARASYKIYQNPTLVGGSFGSVATDSIAEETTGATNITGGEILYQGLLPGTNDQTHVDLSYLSYNSAHRLSAHGIESTTQDTLVVTGKNETTGTTSMRAYLVWEEIR